MRIFAETRSVAANRDRLFQKSFGHAKILLVGRAIGGPSDLRLDLSLRIFGPLGLIAKIFGCLGSIGKYSTVIRYLLGFAHGEILTRAPAARKTRNLPRI